MDPSDTGRDPVANVLAVLADLAGADAPDRAQVLSRLAALHEMRRLLDVWEPRLIAAARDAGVSWADIAPALGVASRQAAERRYLRLREPAPDDHPTQDRRVRAERDRRAGDRAVGAWAREHGADLRQLAGQITALTDLGPAAQASLNRLHEALGHGDAADLLPLLAATHQHLAGSHARLASRVRAVHEDTDQVRRTTARQRARRRSPAPD
ncbi:hypothetical protein [Luedemannella helvata]|uniref:DUF3156 family protein n=1 Tax=Luedemannella helvata TaxID=349315 RepID=A0ABN2KXQ0_9ACTN